MASGANSPRQRMINLMYLVFIAMLALNMSKEVLTTFGEIERQIDKSSKNIQIDNSIAIAAMEGRSTNDSIRWYEPFQTISEVADLAKELDEFIEEIKIIKDKEGNPKKGYVDGIKMRENKAGRKIDGKIPESIGDYERMDNAKDFDELFFKGDGLKETGQRLVDLIDQFRDKSILAIDSSKIMINDNVKRKRWLDKVPGIKSVLLDKFNTDPVKTKAAEPPKDWLMVNFKGFPEIATVTKLTLIQENIQNVIKTLISDINNVISGEDLNTLQSIVVGASGFYENTQLTGTISLGKYDNTFQATSVTINGQKLPADRVMENGQVILEKFGINVGTAGQKDLKGEIIFNRRNDQGETVPVSIPIEHEYFVNPPIANVSNKDMNIVYYGMPNYMRISMPGVSNDNIEIVKPLNILKKTNVPGEYELEFNKKPSGKNPVISIVVRDKASGIVSPPSIFEVVSLPPPIPKLSTSSKKKNDIATAQLIGTYNNDKLDKSLRLYVGTYNVKVGSKNLGVNKGARFTKKVRDAIRQAPKGTTITLSRIRFFSEKINNGVTPLIPENDLDIKIR